MSNSITTAQPQPFSALSSLLTSSLRARSADAIRPYEDQLVRTIQRETRGLAEKLQTAADYFRNEEEVHGTGTVEMDDGVMCALRMSAATARHNKRVLLAYAMQRRNAILDAYWASSGSVPNTLSASSSNITSSTVSSSSAVSDPISKVLTPAELDYLRSHSNLVNDLSRPYHAYTINLLGNLSRGPPKDLFIQVECIKELGEVSIGDGGGMIQFELGSRYFVKRGEVERLIEGGWLKEIEN